MSKVLFIVSMYWSLSLLGASTSDRSKSTWSPQEDSALRQVMETSESKRWRDVAQQLVRKTRILRSGKQCGERWKNHLDPSLTKVPWTEGEFKLLREAHAVFGNKWVHIKRNYLPHRSENDIKNKCGSMLRKEGILITSHKRKAKSTSEERRRGGKVGKFGEFPDPFKDGGDPFDSAATMSSRNPGRHKTTM